MNQKHLLIVDDSDLIVSRLKNLLEGLAGLGGIESAGSYAEALARLSVTPLPDIILLDINLPDLNGIGLLRYTRQHYPQIVVIMQSNQADTFYRDLCLGLGAARYIDKSTEFEQIPTLVAAFCQETL